MTDSFSMIKEGLFKSIRYEALLNTLKTLLQAFLDVGMTLK